MYAQIQRAQLGRDKKKAEKYFSKHVVFDSTRKGNERAQMQATSAMQLRHTSIPADLLRVIHFSTDAVNVC